MYSICMAICLFDCYDPNEDRIKNMIARQDLISHMIEHPFAFVFLKKNKHP